MFKLENVNIYKNKNGDYRLRCVENREVLQQILHKDIIHWAQLYAFRSNKLCALFLNSDRLNPRLDSVYFDTKKYLNGPVVLLLVNRDAEGGIFSYEDLTNYKTDRWHSFS